MKASVGDRVKAVFRSGSVYGGSVVHTGTVVAIHEGEEDPYEIECDYQKDHVRATRLEPVVVTPPTVGEFTCGDCAVLKRDLSRALGERDAAREHLGNDLRAASNRTEELEIENQLMLKELEAYRVTAMCLGEWFGPWKPTTEEGQRAKKAFDDTTGEFAPELVPSRIAQLEADNARWVKRIKVLEARQAYAVGVLCARGPETVSGFAELAALETLVGAARPDGESEEDQARRIARRNAKFGARASLDVLPVDEQRRVLLDVLAECVLTARTGETAR